MRATQSSADEANQDGATTNDEDNERDEAAPTSPEGDIIQFLDVLEDRIVSCRRMPMTQRIFVDVEEFTDLLVQVRKVSQGSSRQARSIVRMRENLLTEARQQSADLIQDTEDRARDLVDEMGIQEVAARESQRILDEAEARASKMSSDAYTYAAEVLVQLRDRLARMRNALSPE